MKWSRAVKKDLLKQVRYVLKTSKITTANYRPFVKMAFYRDDHLNEMPNRTYPIFGNGDRENMAIALMGDSTGKPYFSLGIDIIPDFNFVSPASGGTQTLPRYRYASTGERADNITDWAVKIFASHYGWRGKTAFPGSKDAIFYYVLAVLHDPVYREVYASNLKRDLPRVPLYRDFWKWSAWGMALMKLQANFESADPWPLKRIDVVDKNAKTAGISPKTVLKANKEDGEIVIDSETRLTGVPTSVWEYRLGNRCAIEWILDQYKESAPRDLTVREKFSAYRFAEYKEAVIELLMRVVSVSVETMQIVNKMAEASDLLSSLTEGGE